jgi:DNA-binding response OmpR family regulator
MNAQEQQPLVLVVDDDAGYRQLIRWALEDEGLAVETAGDSRDALESAARRRPALAIVDVALPSGSGIALAEQLRQLTYERFPIITITADGDTELKASLMRATAWLRKPFELEELIAAVWRALDNRRILE